VHVCLIYDCLFPHTVGGAERWYRGLADDLVAAGHEVTYLTRTQWDDEPATPGMRVVSVAPGGPLYGEDGNRRIGPPVRFGLGVFRHLLRHRRRYDAVHTCAFPYFSLLGARAALAGTPVRIGVDWFEVWSRDYWRSYLGPVLGLVGVLVQRLCVRLTPEAYVFSDLHARRLEQEGVPRPPIRLAGLFTGSAAEAAGAPPGERAPVVVYAGRHIAEKRAELIPEAIAAARRRIPDLRATIFGDGPKRPDVLAEIERLGLQGVVDAPGFVSTEEVDAGIGSAAALVLPSLREGYGMVVIEANAAGTPAVVVAGEDNAAAELVEEGVNGTVAEDVDGLSDAIVRAVQGGAALQRSTAAWYAEHAGELSASSSAARIRAALSGAPG
jgi:glycosyltransferase involved in cell wall biosynthesis